MQTTVKLAEQSSSQSSTKTEAAAAFGNFAPSRKRTLSGAIMAGASGSQPSGRALPSLISPTPSSPQEHLVAALELDPSAVLLDRAFAGDAKAAMFNCANAPKAVLCRRGKAVAFLREAAGQLEGARGRRAAALPENSPAVGIHFPLVHFLAAKLNFPDTTLVKELALGMPIVGRVGACGSLTGRPRPAIATIQEWRRDMPARNAMIVNRVKTDNDEISTKKVFEKSMAEAKKGWLSTPTVLTKATMDMSPLTPRFGQWERHGLSDWKVRMIDDFKVSGINNILSTEDTSVPENLDAGLARIALYKRLAPGCVLNVTSVDFAHAYKHIPLTESQKEFATIISKAPGVKSCLPCSKPNRLEAAELQRIGGESKHS